MIGKGLMVTVGLESHNLNYERNPVPARITSFNNALYQ